MFSYCLNNPVIFADLFGQDAIIVVNRDKKTGGLFLVGHIYLYIEDESGNWYKTEFSGDWRNPASAMIKTKVCRGQQLSEINKLKNYEQIKGHYSLYIKGNYSESAELAKNYNYTNYGGYDLLFRNCLHYAREILRAGKAADEKIQRAIEECQTIIPINFYSYVAIQCIQVMRETMFD